MLHRRIDLRISVRPELVTPGRFVVSAFLRVEARKRAFVITGQFETFLDDERRVGLVDDVISLNAVVAEREVDYPAEEGDVRAGPNRRKMIGHRRRAIEPRVNADQFRVTVFLGFNRPFKAAWVVLRRVAAHYQ